MLVDSLSLFNCPQHKTQLDGLDRARQTNSQCFVLFDQMPIRVYFLRLNLGNVVGLIQVGGVNERLRLGLQSNISWSRIRHIQYCSRA
jgi:hypothetical protein